MKSLKAQVIWNYTSSVKSLKSAFYPAISVRRSGTRREDLLMKEDELQRVWISSQVIK